MSVICLKAYREQRLIRSIGAHALAAEPKADTWSFDEIKQQLRARFGEQGLPEWVETAWESLNAEPYEGGDVGNCAWSAYKIKMERLGRWNRPHPFAMPMDPTSNAIGRDVAKGGNDPLAWMDMKYRNTWNHIKTRANQTLSIHTRSDLIAHDDYLAVLNKSFHEVYIHVLTDNEGYGRIVEPGCPSYKRRIGAYEKLKSLGFNVILVHDRFTNSHKSACKLKRPVGQVNEIRLTKPVQLALSRVGVPSGGAA